MHLNSFLRGTPADNIIVELAPPAVAVGIDEDDVVTAMVVP